MKERLQKIISSSGLTSRRKAEDLIKQGRVHVNGLTVSKLGSQADPHNDTIDVDGIIIGQPENRVYILLNKPRGYITSVNDPEGRQTVINLVKNVQERIFPVGRLDYDTEGLLILTNDGHFAQILQHPKSNIPRKYLVKINDFPSKLIIDKLQKGIFIDGKKTGKAKIKIIDRTQKNSWLEVILWEGRNRQIKDMFEAVGHRVLKIIRTEFGPLQLNGLASGSHRFLTRKEIKSITDIEK